MPVEFIHNTFAGRPVLSKKDEEEFHEKLTSLMWCLIRGTKTVDNLNAACEKIKELAEVLKAVDDVKGVFTFKRLDWKDMIPEHYRNPAFDSWDADINGIIAQVIEAFAARDPRWERDHYSRIGEKALAMGKRQDRRNKERGY